MTGRLRTLASLVFMIASSLGVEAATDSSDPKVEVVAGRKAATFDGNDTMVATFVAPDAITGNSDYTVAVWAYKPSVGPEECMVEWARRGTMGRAAQLNFSDARGWGAVTHWSEPDMGFDGGVPSAGEWHHIAVTYSGGTNGIETVYVDGVVNATEEKTLDLWHGDPVRLGSTEAGHWFKGSLSEVKIYDSALTADEIAFLAGRGGTAPKELPLVDLSANDLVEGPLSAWPNHGTLKAGFGKILAYGEKPRSGETIGFLEATLTWSAGGLAASHDIYFGTDKAEIAHADKASPLYKGNQPIDSTTYGPVSLSLGERCYWRIDEINRLGEAEWGPGTVWSFRANTGQAYDPHPRDGGILPADTKELSWTPGHFVVSQDLSFGTNRDVVADTTVPSIGGLAADVSRVAIPVLPLEPSEIYYWRVDSTNSNLPESTGEVWSFRVAEVPRYGDITFFSISDSHYEMNADENRSQNAAVKRMNALPGTEYPEDLGGGFVAIPRGVLALGDLIDDGGIALQGPDQWAAWVADFGLNGGNVLNYPVYEGFGNHDLSQTYFIQDAMSLRNRERKDVTNVSSNGLHYSWDWDHVHLVNVNLFPGNKHETPNYGPIHDPEGALDFLIADLAENVGNSGRPVVIGHHYDPRDNWWTDSQKEEYTNAIKDYNVIAIVHGHTGTGIYQWKGIDVVNDGNLGGSVFVFHMTGDELVVVQRRSDDTWGTSLKKSITGFKKPE